MNKNAYEIRLEVLQMANNSLMSLFNAQCTQIHQTQSKGGAVFASDISALFPSVEDVKKRAMELYKFVEVK